MDYTDYDANLPLECVERSQFDEEFQDDLKNSGVVFGCTGSGRMPTPPSAVYQPFTKKCTRSDEDKLETFTCYEMADKTNFQPLVKEAQDIRCPTQDGEPDVPLFQYKVTLRREVPGHEDGTRRRRKQRQCSTKKTKKSNKTTSEPRFYRPSRDCFSFSCGSAFCCTPSRL